MPLQGGAVQITSSQGEEGEGLIQEEIVRPILYFWGCGLWGIFEVLQRFLTLWPNTSHSKYKSLWYSRLHSNKWESVKHCIVLTILRLNLGPFDLKGERGAVDRASDSEYMNGCPAWVRARLVPQICVSFLCPWARHFTLIVPWFGGHVKPSVPCACI